MKPTDMVTSLRSQKGLKIAQQTHADMVLLATLWPRVFILEPTKAKNVYPLAIGIHQAIYPATKARGMSGVRLRRALRIYCSGLAYQYALAKGRPRINLTGRIVANVDEDHQRQAREKVKEILSKRNQPQPNRDEVTPLHAKPKFRGTLTLRKKLELGCGRRQRRQRNEASAI